jgi:hypothetical protein
LCAELPKAAFFNFPLKPCLLLNLLAMKAFALFLIAIILLNAVILVCGKKFVPPSGESTGEERLALLRSLHASSSNGLITLDNESYE